MRKTLILNLLRVDLEEDLIDLEDIEFLDEELEEISEEVEVSEGEKVFDITDQISDLMDDLLVEVPSSKQYTKILKIYPYHVRKI